jgi:amino acid permease
MVSAMSSMMAVSSVITPLISCIYPVLALYFLNRRDAKEWSAARLSGAA